MLSELGDERDKARRPCPNQLNGRRGISSRARNEDEVDKRSHTPALSFGLRLSRALSKISNALKFSSIGFSGILVVTDSSLLSPGKCLKHKC